MMVESELEKELQVAFIQIPEFRGKRDEYAPFLARADQLWKNLYEKIPNEGSLWVLASNSYVDGELLPLPLDLADRIRRVSEFKLRNILTIYREGHPREGKPFIPSYFHILFFVKSIRDYYFDKDSIREPHVFKGIEWGKRTMGESGYGKGLKPRYHPKGHDIGNVLYKVKRNSEGNILDIYECGEEEIYEKIVKVVTRREWVIVTNITDPAFIKVVTSLGRKIKLWEVKF